MASLQKNHLKKSLVIAEYFIKKSKEDKNKITNKKLQKLLYYSQAWNLAIKGKKMFPDSIEAWIHGPAVPDVYTAFKEFGSEEIDIEIKEENFDLLSGEEKEMLDSVWEVYGKYPADYLETLTHSEEPWQKAREGLSVFESSNNIISPRLMQDYYGEKIKKASETKK